MKCNHIWSAVLVVGLLFAAGLPAAEEPLPEALAAKVKELAPEGTVRRTQPRDRRGENYYRVDLDLPGEMNGRIDIKPDGTLLEVRLELSADQLPAPVKKTLAELYPNATFDNADRNLNDGKLVIDAEYKQDGRTLTVTVDDAGVVLDREDEITLADLPAAAQKAITRDFAGATISRIRRILRNGVDLFEVRVERRMTVHLPDPAGSTTTEREVPAADLPEATRLAAQAATGRNPVEVTIIQRTTSQVTVYEIQVNERRDLQFNLEGIMLNQPEAAAQAIPPVAAAGQQPARGAPNAGNRFGGRGNGPGPGNNRAPGGPREPDRGQERGQAQPADAEKPAPGAGNPPPPEEIF